MIDARDGRKAGLGGPRSLRNVTYKGGGGKDER